MRIRQSFLPALLLYSLAVAAGAPVSAAGGPAGYRNIAVNPLDIHDSLWNKMPVRSYPHATSNSECRMETPFLARCAINDTLRNTCHGAGCPSWGPELVTDAWWKVDFGKKMAMDSVTVFIRADFPHDGYWYSARITFSDSSRMRIALDSTARPQGFKFSRRMANWMRIDSLVWHVPNTWCAFTQVQVWGNDTVSTGVTGKSERASSREASRRTPVNRGTHLLNGRSVPDRVGKSTSTAYIR